MTQSLSQVYLHIIYHTSATSPIIPTDILPDLHRYHAGICNKHKIPAIAIGGVEDHVHTLIRFNRTQTIAEFVQLLKKATSNWLKKQSVTHPIMNDFHWQNGYGAFSVSHSNLGSVKRYIENQREHHKKMTFRDEYILFLEKHGVEYDEKYLWRE